METAEDNAVATECCVHASGLLAHVTSELLQEFFLEECRHLGRGEVRAVIPTEDRGAVICFNDRIVRDSILQRHQQYYAEGNHLFTTLSECPDDLAREVAKSFSATRGRQLRLPSSHMEAVKTDITTAENIHQVHTHTQPIYENATAGWFNPGAANPYLRHSYSPQYSQGYSQSAAGFGPPFIRGGSPWVPAPFATGPSIKGSYVPWGPPPDINYSFDSESSMIHDCMIVVHGFAPHTSEKAIKQYFESEFLAKGDPMKSFDYNAQTRVACFTYRDPKVAAKVLEKRSHQLDDTVLNVTANYVRSHQQHQQQTQINTENKLDETIVDTASQSTEIKVDLKTIKVQGFNCATRSETIQMFFESKKRSGGGEIESFQITNKNAALIAFKDPEEAQAVLDRGVLELEGANLNTSVYTPQKEELKTIEVRGFKQTTQDSTFEMFFESQKYSGGGPIESINIDRPNEVISITFCNTEVADRVLRKGTLELEGACLTITRARKKKKVPTATLR